MSTSSRVFKSSAFLLVIQVVQRTLGLISTLILARLLLPEDFGILALVAIALQFFEVLADAGNKHYIIQKTEVTDIDLNTAWTMNLGIKVIIALLIIFSSPLLADFFDTQDLQLALSVAALSLPIGALRSPILMMMARQLNYRPVFVLSVWQKVVSFVVVVSLAVTYQTFWAIIAGNLVAATVMTIGSYRIDTYRPSFTLAQLSVQWDFSKWLILRGMVGFTRSQVDNLFVGKLYGSAQLGAYHLIRDIATFPAISVVVPGSEPLQAAIAERKTKPAELAYRIRLSLLLMICLITPITLFMATYGELLVNVILGPQWNEYDHMLRPFSLFFFTFCLFALVSDTFVATAQVRTLFWFDVFSTAIIVGLLAMTTEIALESMAWLRGLLAVITTIALLLVLERKKPFNLTRLLALSALGLPPCAIALGLTHVLAGAFAPQNAFIRLVLLATTFFTVAGGLLLLTCVIGSRRITELEHLWHQAVKLILNVDSRIRKR